MTVPRKLPRTQGQRVQNVARNHAAQSLGGSTAAARPVANVKPDVKLYAPPTSGGNVITGQMVDTTSVSIGATVAGDGLSDAGGADSVAIGPYATTSAIHGVAVGYNAEATAARGVTIGANSSVGAHEASASSDGIAIGTNACVTAGSTRAAARGIAVGVDSNVGGGAVNALAAIAIGSGADAQGDYSLAVGGGLGTDSAGGGGNYDTGARADADGSVAIGTDHTGTSAHATTQDDFMLGTANHHVIVPGSLILSDGGTLYRLTVTGGVLGLVAYP